MQPGSSFSLAAEEVGDGRESPGDGYARGIHREEDGGGVKQGGRARHALGQRQGESEPGGEPGWVRNLSAAETPTSERMWGLTNEAGFAPSRGACTCARAPLCLHDVMHVHVEGADGNAARADCAVTSGGQTMALAPCPAERKVLQRSTVPGVRQGLLAVIPIVWWSAGAGGRRVAGPLGRGRALLRVGLVVGRGGGYRAG